MSNHPICEECSPNFTCQECLRDEWEEANDPFIRQLRGSISIENAHFLALSIEATKQAEASCDCQGCKIEASAENLRTMDSRFSSAPATD